MLLNIKVTLSSTGGPNRAIQLASEFDKRGYLHKLYIPYYSRKHIFLTNLFGRNYDNRVIDINKVRTNLAYTLISKIRLSSHINSLLGLRSFFLSEAFDKWVARKIDEDANVSNNIIMAESIMALHTIKRAKELGMITVLDTTNSHILNQTEILENEYCKLGMKYNLTPSTIIRKSINEYNEADYIILRSSYVKKTFIERNIPEDKLFVVPAGVELELFKQTAKEDNFFRIIYCGKSCIKKGTHYLLQAYRELNLKNAELWLIGNVHRDMKPLLERYSDCFKLIGYVQQKDLHKYYSQGSILVLPSLEEGLAKVMIEAMACGLPVIATENAGAEDIIRNGIDGFIIPANSIEALKEKILVMYENSNICLVMSQNAKNAVSNNFSLETYSTRMLDFFKKISDKRFPKQTSMMM